MVRLNNSWLNHQTRSLFQSLHQSACSKQNLLFIFLKMSFNVFLLIFQTIKLSTHTHRTFLYTRKNMFHNRCFKCISCHFMRDLNITRTFLIQVHEIHYFQIQFLWFKKKNYKLFSGGLR